MIKGARKPLHFHWGTDDCLKINKYRGFTTTEAAQQHALKKVKQLYKQIGDSL